MRIASGCAVAVALVMLATATGRAQFATSSGTSGGGSSSASAPAPQNASAKVSVDATNEDAVALIKRLAGDARVNVVFTTDVKRPVTLSLHDTAFDQAVTFIARSAGLAVERMDAGYAIGASDQVVYRAKYVRADRLMETLKATFPGDRLRIITGSDEYQSPSLQARPSLVSASGSSSDGSSSYGSSSSGSSQPPPPTPPPAPGAIRQIVLAGDSATVAQALALCKELDVARRQVRFSVKFTNFDFEWLREYGLRWNWDNLSLAERADATTGSLADKLKVFSLGALSRNPMFLEAAISAGQDSNNAVLKSVPSITVLDGEHGFILVGEKHLYPKLTGYTQAQTPIYDKEQVEVGISLDLGVTITGGDDMVLTLLPQVSGIIGYLQAGETAYPQISTLEQQTTIHVRDGETVVIGGLLSEKTVDVVHGVPGIMDVPVLGKLFTYRKKESQKLDLVVLITAEIIKEDRQ